MLAVVVVLLVVLVVVAVLAVLGSPPLAYRRTVVRRRVIVNTDRGESFRGILWATRGPLLVLRSAERLVVGEQPQRVDGEVVVERARVEFLQVLATTVEA